MRFTRLQMIVITLCVFVFATGGLQHTLKQKMVMNAEADLPDGGDVIESDLEEPAQFPLKKKGEPGYQESVTTTESSSDPVNINMASKPELLSVKGMTETLVDSIIQFREEGNYFATKDDLMNVPGMTRDKLDMIKSHFYIGAKTAESSTTDSASNKPEYVSETKQDKPASQTVVKPTPKPRRSKNVNAQSGKININTADANQLRALPRIGPKMAQRIIEFREQNGPFKKPRDITRVKGIGPKTFERMADMITVE